MPPYLRTILTILFSLWAVAWGESLQAAKNSSQPADSVVVAVLGSGYQTVTYKGSMEVFGKHFSGLYFFKQMGEDKKRMVVLSEFGLNLLDFQFSADSAQLMNAQDFLNKPGLIELLKGDFGFLVRGLQASDVVFCIGLKPVFNHIRGLQASDVVKYRLQPNAKDVALTKIKTDNGRFTLYHRVTDGRLVKVKQRQNWFSSVIYAFAYQDSHLPEEILIRHTGIPFKMKLKKIKEE